MARTGRQLGQALGLCEPGDMTIRGKLGFTLIELMIVMAIVLILGATAVGFGGRYVARRQLETAAVELVQDLRQTQSDALFGRRTLVFTLDVAANSYSFQRAQGSMDVTHQFNSTVGFASVVTGSASTGSSVNFGAVTSPSAPSVDLYFDWQGSPALNSSGTNRITLTEGQIILADRSGDTIRIYISSVLGRVRMGWE